jgi:hypothetical protein
MEKITKYRNKYVLKLLLLFLGRRGAVKKQGTGNTEAGTLVQKTESTVGWTAKEHHLFINMI